MMTIDQNDPIGAEGESERLPYRIAVPIWIFFSVLAWLPLYFAYQAIVTP